MSERQKLPDLLLEQLALDELPGAGSEVLKETEADRLEQLEASNRAILEEYPPELVGPQIERRFALEQTIGPRRRPWAIAVPAIASAAIAVLLVWAFIPTSVDQGVANLYPEQVRIKGDARIIIHRQAGEASEELSNRTEAVAGDVLQLSYLAAGQTHGVLFSVDGRGAVTLHFPADKAGSTLLVQGGAQALPFSYELDDAPAFERFVFVTSTRTLDIRQILSRVGDLGPEETTTLDLPDGYMQQHFWVIKPR